MGRADTQRAAIAHMKARQEKAAASAVQSKFASRQSQFVRMAEERAVMETSAPSTNHFESRPQPPQRAARRQSRYALNDASEQPLLDQQLGALLGSRVTPDAADGEEPSAKRGRRERLEDVMGQSKATKRENQMRLVEHDKLTLQLDEEFDGSVSQLLVKRSRADEEREAFLKLGTEETKEALKKYEEQRGVTAGAKGRIFSLGDDGTIARVDNSNAPEQPKPNSKTENIITERKKERAVVEKHDEERAAAEVDDFDKLMNVMHKDTKWAHAAERTKTEEEEQRETLAARLTQLDRSAVEHVVSDAPDLSRAEWVRQGGDAVQRMDEEEDHAEQGVAATDAFKKNSRVVDALRGLESCFDEPQSLCKKSLSEHVLELYDACRGSPKHAIELFRLLLSETQRRIVRQEIPSAYMLFMLYAASVIFPLTDRRHDVVTPLTILLCTAISSCRLTSLCNVGLGLWYCSILLDILSATKRFSSEPLVLLYNVLSLQLPVDVTPPSSMCPLLVRESALLHPVPNDATPKPLSLLSFCAQACRGAPSIADLLNAAYSLTTHWLATYQHLPAFDLLAEPLSALLSQLPPVDHAQLRKAHLDCATQLEAAMLACRAGRTPLAMRTFRPRPLRMYEPLLIDPTSSEVQATKELKKQFREDRKRTVRHVQAEAEVERRDRERAADDESARREANYRVLMGELQQQQHIMKTADSFRMKAKQKKRKSISGEPDRGDDNAEE